MNLKQKLNNKTTSTVQIISNTQAIYSDEITSNPNSLQIITADNKEHLWSLIREQSIKDANTQQRFQPIINLITLTHYKVINLHTNQTLINQPLSTEEPPSTECPI